MYNRSDLTTEALTEQVMRRMLLWTTGYSRLPNLDPAVSSQDKWAEYKEAWANFEKFRGSVAT